jgi:hypothetical protein
MMDYREDQLEREKQGILERLRATAGWGKITDPAEQRDAHRLGTIESLLAKLRG